MKKLSMTILTAVLALGPIQMGYAEDPPKKPWTNEADLALVSTNGNSKATTMSAKDKFIYTWSQWVAEVFAGGFWSSSEGSSTAEQYHLGEKVEYKLDDHNYLFEIARWDKDRFAGIRNRYDFQTGYGRHWIKTDIHHFRSEAGVGYISEERKNQRRNGFADGRLYGEYELKLSETSDFSQNIEYIWSFEDGRDYRVHTETALKAKISANISMKAAYVIKHLNKPPRGFGKTDTITLVGLSFKY